MSEVILSMEHFGTIGIVFCLLLLIGFGVILIHEIRAARKMETEHKKCFTMISRCSQLLRLLEDNAYMTDSDFNFLKFRIYRNYVRIHNMPRNAVSSERERRILAEGLHWTSVSRKCENEKYGKEINQANTSCPYEAVLNIAVAGFTGFSECEDIYEDLEWIYYMWLMSISMRTMHSQKFTDQKKLGELCIKIEKWSSDWNMNSRYLKDKLETCYSLSGIHTP